MTQRSSLVLALAVTLGLVAGAFTPDRAVAQQVGGRLAALDGGPVPWALVRLVDESGKDVARDVTTASGTFLLFAPGPGTYRVRTERIGFQATLSDPLELERGERESIDLIASDAPIELAALDVRSEGSCGLRPDEGSDLLTIWTEVEKALELQAATETSGLYSFQVQVYEYIVDRKGRPADPRKAREETQELRMRSFSAFRAADPELLVERGFRWENGSFYAPDAHTLLSDAFQRTHCYRAHEKDGLIGLEFKPASLRGLVEVSGTLWLDDSGKLSHLEYDYVTDAFHKLPVQGGYIEFEQLPEGAWIVRRWYIRAPVDYNSLAGYNLEAGGKIVEVDRLAEAETPAAAPGAVAGAAAQDRVVYSAPEPASIAPPLDLPASFAAGLSEFNEPPDSAAVEDILAREPSFASSPAGEAAAARAGLWRRAGRYDLALAELDAAEPDDPRRGLVEAERARVLFATGRADEATTSFRTACATGDTLALGALWMDLRGLATAAEYRDWRTSPAEMRCDLLSRMVAERAWRSGLRVRDRLALHYARLEWARSTWHVPEPRDRGGTVDRFGWRPELELDDRGLVYLRMGAPNDVDRAVAGVDSTTGVWIDAWQWVRPGGGRTVYFVSPMHPENGEQDWRLHPEPWQAATGQFASDQMDIVTDMAIDQATGALTLGPHDEIYRQFGGLDPYTTPGTQRTLQIRRALVDTAERDREAATADAEFVMATIPDAPELIPSVRFGWEYLRFYDPPSGNTTLWVLVAALAGDLTPVVDDAGWSEYKADVILAARDGTSVSTDSVQTLVRLPGRLEDENGLVAGVSVSAPPGEHPFTLVLKDGNSEGRRQGNWQRGAVTGIEPTGLPEISDIAVAADSGGAWTRDGSTYLQVSPSHVTARDGSVHIYFEVYGVPDGKPYTVEVRVVPRDLAERLWQLDASDTAFGLSFGTEMPPSGGLGTHHLLLDLSDSRAGDYTIGIRITEDDTGRRSLPATTPIVRE